MLRNKRSAFTLLEMAIVLVIIGLIAGGILVARDMIETAKINQQIAQIEKYKTSVNAFRLKYGSFPGDIGVDRAVSFGFQPREIDIVNFPTGSGNEDGKITFCAQTQPAQDWAAQGCENILLWRDLSDANMIDGGFQTATDEEIGRATFTQGLHGHNMPLSFWSRYLPAAKLENSWILAYSHIYNGCGVFGIWCPPANKNFFLLTGISQIIDKNVGTRYTIIPRIARRIDEKIDDGFPMGGKTFGYSLRPGWENVTFIQSNAGSSLCGNDDYDSGAGTLDSPAGRYNVHNDTPLCIMAFEF